MEEAEAAIGVTMVPDRAGEVPGVRLSCGALLGGRLCCLPSQVLPLRLLPELPFPLDQAKQILVPLLQLLLVGGDVLCFAGGQLGSDELGSQRQKAL